MFIHKIIKHKDLIFKHLIVSFICAGTELVSFTLLWKLNPTIIYFDYTMAFLIATTLGFFLHSRYTFSAKDKLKSRALLFIMQASLVLLTGLTIFRILVSVVPHPLIAKLIQLLITFGLNVTIGKKITFKKVEK